jgi:hypothetical protein
MPLEELLCRLHIELLETHHCHRMEWEAAEVLDHEPY